MTTTSADESLDLRVLRRTAQIPTASFYEDLVLRETEKVARELFGDNPAIQIARDSVGNLLVQYQGDPEKRNQKSVAFVVHTDHPAFHLNELVDQTRRGTSLYHAKLMGGLNHAVLMEAHVQLHYIETDEAVSAPGII